MKQEIRKLKDLNLLDRFLFAEAMERPEIMRTVLEIILGKEVVLKTLPQTEKEERNSPLNRYVRLDVWAQDEQEAVYNTEVQKVNTKNLPKRSRLYQGMIDSKLLEPGEVDFNRLNQVYIILIMPFDLFGEGLYQYTFQMRCDQRKERRLEDGAVRIFLNTHGTKTEGTTPELIELLKYIESSTDKTDQACKSERIHSLHRQVEKIKSNEEIGVKYMQEWEERVIEKRQARQEGLREGAAEANERYSKLIVKMSEAGRMDELVKAAQDAELLQKLYQEYGL